MSILDLEVKQCNLQGMGKNSVLVISWVCNLLKVTLSIQVAYGDDIHPTRRVLWESNKIFPMKTSTSSFKASSVRNFYIMPSLMESMFLSQFKGLKRKLSVTFDLVF